MKVGDLVKSRLRLRNPRLARTGLVMQLREGAFENQPLAQVYWPHNGSFGWVEAKDMEIVSESR